MQLKSYSYLWNLEVITEVLSTWMIEFTPLILAIFTGEFVKYNILIWKHLATKPTKPKQYDP